MVLYTYMHIYVCVCVCAQYTSHESEREKFHLLPYISCGNLHET